MRDVLQHNGFAGARRRHNQPALAFSLRSHQIDDAGGIVLVAANNVKVELFRRVKRREVVKIDAEFGFFRIVKIDAVDFG